MSRVTDGSGFLRVIENLVEGIEGGIDSDVGNALSHFRDINKELLAIHRRVVVITETGACEACVSCNEAWPCSTITAMAIR